MKRKLDFLWLACFVLLCAMFLLPSCTYDASYFKGTTESSPCPDGQFLCDTVCVTIDTKEHCGSCRNICAFDRSCKKNEGNPPQYECVCPDGRKDCGKDLSCSLLDGGVKNPNDKRCGSCNTICASSETCEINKCVCAILGGGFLSDTSGQPLTGQALSEEYLRNDDNCGDCGKACLDGMHCVLGKCTKTECIQTKDEFEECHFTLPDGREECQPCRQKCRQIGGDLNKGIQSLLIPIIGEGENAQLNESNTSPQAYKEVDGYKIKRALNCKCGEKISELCIPGASDRCDAKQCVCGVDSDVCSGLTCTTEGCKAPCDDLKRACTGTASCTDKVCQCAGAQPQEGVGGAKFAHCVDGLKCNNGKCYCTNAGASPKECGVLGDRCTEKGICVCGISKEVCSDGLTCKDGLCVCGKNEVCDPKFAPNCVNDKCVCGTAENPQICNENQECKDKRCQCAKHEACQSKTTDTCKGGKCVCGSSKDPCLENETCVSGQCTCGGGNRCKNGSTCNAAGNCQCDDDYDCIDDEYCRKIGDLGYICVCSPSLLQKSCKLGAQCKYSDEKNRCQTTNVKACYGEEKLYQRDSHYSLHCVCGDLGRSCGPGEICDGGQCLSGSAGTTSPPNPN